MPAKAQPARRVPITLIQGASSAYDGSINRTNLQQVTTANPTSPDPINREEWYDPLDTRVTRGLKTLQTLSTINYDGSPFTTISYKYLGSSTAWWIILQYNGYMHPDDVPMGAILGIPDIQPIKDAIRASALPKGGVIVI